VPSLRFRDPAQDVQPGGRSCSAGGEDLVHETSLDLAGQAVSSRSTTADQAPWRWSAARWGDEPRQRLAPPPSPPPQGGRERPYVNGIAAGGRKTFYFQSMGPRSPAAGAPPQPPRSEGLAYEAPTIWPCRSPALLTARPRLDDQVTGARPARAAGLPSTTSMIPIASGAPAARPPPGQRQRPARDTDVAAQDPPIPQQGVQDP